jgi:TM2 domain-containing membrane protein YozV
MASTRASRVGTTGNVIAALASFFIPGLGQLLQGRVLWAIIWFVGSIVWWIITLGLLSGVVHVLSCLHAAIYNPPP